MLVSWNGKDNNIKVVLLGESGVGKSSLASRFVSETYQPYNESTIGANYLSKSIDLSPSPSVVDQETSNSLSTENGSTYSKDLRKESTTKLYTQKGNKMITFKMWDTAGQEKYRSLVPMYYRGAGGAVLVFDLTRIESLKCLRRWVDELKERGPSDIILVLCGNKSDLVTDRRVEYSMGKAFADEIGAIYFEASAREGSNVYEIFEEIATRISAVDEALFSGTKCTCSDEGVIMEPLEGTVLSMRSSGAGGSCC